jgi:hypothetical protein
MRPPDGVASPSPEPEPLPEALTKLDFSRWQAIAFVDGAVDLSTSSRITAVVDSGDRLEVRTTRWIAPPNPASGPSPSSRVHIIAIPRSDKPVAFIETAVLDGTAKAGEGGYGMAGGPIMNPKWKAVPNPELTREKVEDSFRGMYQGAKLPKLSVEKRTIEWVRANLNPEAARQRYTSDSEVWVVVAEGDLPNMGPGGDSLGHGVGGTESRVSRMVALVSIESDFPQPFETMSQTVPGKPGFRFELEPQGDMYLGDTLRFAPQGEPVAGSLTLTVTLNGAAPVVREVPFVELATFAFPLDHKTLPSLTDAPVQPISIKVEYETSPGQRATMGRDVKLIRDRDAKATPPMRVQGPGTPEEYHPATGESAWDAFARDIAATDWQGRDLRITSRSVRYADIKPEPAYNFDMVPETPIRIYEIRGTFPTFIVPAAMSGLGIDEVLAPKRLVVAVTEQVPVVVVGMDAYAN